MITKAAFGHFGISLLKSILRIVGCIFMLKRNITIMAWCFLSAEVLGILEEIFDKR